MQSDARSKMKDNAMAIVSFAIRKLQIRPIMHIKCTKCAENLKEKLSFPLPVPLTHLSNVICYFLFLYLFVPIDFTY